MAKKQLPVLTVRTRDPVGICKTWARQLMNVWEPPRYDSGVFNDLARGRELLSLIRSVSFADSRTRKARYRDLKQGHHLATELASWTNQRIRKVDFYQLKPTGSLNPILLLRGLLACYNRWPRFEVLHTTSTYPTIVCRIPNITIEGISFGDFDVVGSRTSIRAIACTPRYPVMANRLRRRNWRSVTHPHVKDDIVCMGSGTCVWNTSMDNYDFYGALSTLEGVLRTYNPASPYAALSAWLPYGRCPTCLTPHLVASTASCSYCHHQVCSQCGLRACPICGGLTCQSCERTCSCGGIGCRGCVGTCEFCNTSVCGACDGQDEHSRWVHKNCLTGETNGSQETPSSSSVADSMGENGVPF